MTTEIYIGALLCIAAFAIDEWRNHRRTRRYLTSANTDLRERLAIVTGQLADERQRHALRINRAHEGACKAAKTRRTKRIQLPDVVTESAGNQLAASPL